MYLRISALLGLMLCGFQDPPIPHEVQAGADIAFTYEIQDLGPKSPDAVRRWHFFGSELRGAPRFDRFNMYQVENLPAEFLFQLPPADVAKGGSWSVDVLLGESGLAYATHPGDALHPRVQGTYTLRKADRIGDNPAVWVITGKFDVHEFRLLQSGDAALKWDGDLKDRKRKLGTLEVELRVRPATGILEEATYAVRLDAPHVLEKMENGTLRKVLQSGPYVRNARVRLAVEQKISRETLAKPVRAASAAAAEWILSRQAASGFFSPTGRGEGDLSILLAAVNAILASGGGADHRAIRLALGELRTANVGEYRFRLAQLQAMSARYFPMNLDRFLDSIDPGELAVRREAVPDRAAFDAVLKVFLDAQQDKFGLWSGG